MIDKESIKRSFSKAAPTYDASADVQKEAALMLADCIGVFMGNTGRLELTTHEMGSPVLRERVEGLVTTPASPLVLDAGCGTGSMMKEIAGRWPACRFVGADLALPMLQKARENTGNAATVAADCDSLPFRDNAFDMIVSNLAFQWADLNRAFAEAARTLKPGGLVIFSTLGPDTLSEFRAACMEAAAGVEFPLTFHGVDELTGGLDRAGLEPLSAECFPFFKRYDSITSLVRTLKNIGAAPPMRTGAGLSGGVMLRRAERVYRRRSPAPGGTGIIATYDVIFVAARKR